MAYGRVIKSRRAAAVSTENKKTFRSLLEHHCCTHRDIQKALVIGYSCTVEQYSRTVAQQLAVRMDVAAHRIPYRSLKESICK